MRDSVGPATGRSAALTCDDVNIWEHLFPSKPTQPCLLVEFPALLRKTRACLMSAKLPSAVKV